MNSSAYFQWRIKTKQRINIYDIQNFSSSESLGQFNQIWHKASLGKGVQVFRNKDHLIFKMQNKKSYFFLYLPHVIIVAFLKSVYFTGEQCGPWVPSSSNISYILNCKKYNYVFFNLDLNCPRISTDTKVQLYHKLFFNFNAFFLTQNLRYNTSLIVMLFV